MNIYRCIHHIYIHIYMYLYIHVCTFVAYEARGTYDKNELKTDKKALDLDKRDL